MGGFLSSVQARLSWVIGGGIGLLLLISSIAIFQLKSHLQEYDDLMSGAVTNEQDIQGINFQFKVQVQEWKNVLLRGKDPEKYQKYWGEFSRLQNEIQKNATQLAQRLPNDDSKKMLQDFVRAHDAAFQKYQAGVQAFSAADFNPSVGDKAVTGIDRETSKLLVEASNFISERVQSLNAEIRESSRRIVIWSEVIVIAVGIAIILFVLFNLKNNFVTPLHQLNDHIEKLSYGNFRNRLEIHQADEWDNLSKNIGNMQTALIAIIRAVQDSSNTINQAANTITSNTQVIASDAEHTHAATDQVAAAINEMSATVQEVARSASGAANAAQDADSFAKKSSSIMDNTISSIKALNDEVDKVNFAMTQLENDTARIGSVLDVIKSVAEQTNLLALNAAIEAARAGEQGSNKALLAMQSSQSKTQATNQLVNQAGAAINDVTEAVARIHTMNTQIATAAEEQSYAAEEIDKNVTRVVSLVEHAEQSAQNSSQIAKQLMQSANDLSSAAKHFLI